LTREARHKPITGLDGAGRCGRNLTGCYPRPSRLSRECPECVQGRFQRSSQRAGSTSETWDLSGARDWSRTSPGVRPECRGKRHPPLVRIPCSFRLRSHCLGAHAREQAPGVRR
jgi:hypothetical protein